MSESQIVEYKESWKDDYLKWLCGFANAQGGTLYIGIDDNGTVVGVKDSKKLMEDLPNKIQSGLGIVADVNRHTRNGLDYIEIKVIPSGAPISYHGEFHYRSGTTKQQLTGIALSEFITRKTGFRWEDVTVDGITVEDLDDESFKIFRREALRRKRMTKADLDVPNAELLSKLHLMSGGKLKRSAVLLFYHDPSIVQNGSCVKVGRFVKDIGLYYDDNIEESLIVTASRVVDLIYWKYLKAKISFEHDRRLEIYPFARDAIREAVYNAIAHNCYMYGTPIQIRIEDEEMIISNRCILPENWTVETLMEPHDSIPYNPDIANVFYRAGFIERWGRGIETICDACREIGAELPVYELRGTSLRVHFKALESALIRDDIQAIKADAPAHVSNNHISDPVGLLDDPVDPVNDPVDAVGDPVDPVNSAIPDPVDSVNDPVEKLILDLMWHNPVITYDELSSAISVSRSTVVRSVRKLRANGVVVRIGGDRYGHWQVMK